MGEWFHMQAYVLQKLNVLQSVEATASDVVSTSVHKLHHPPIQDLHQPAAEAAARLHRPIQADPLQLLQLPAQETVDQSIQLIRLLQHLSQVGSSAAEASPG
eukprot:2315845-Amphidinium_carterae.1